PSGDAFTGVWFGVLLPYAASNMPFFLVALAWASDLKGNPLETMDLQEYEALERKQANFLRVQVEQRELRAALETRLIAIEQMERQNKRLRRKKLPKTFRWFWEKPADLEAVIATVAMQLKTMFDADLPPRDEQQQVQVGQLPVAREMPSPTTDLSSSRQKQASGHQACGRVPNGLTSDLFEGDQEPTSLPIMYVHSIPHTVRFPAKKNECQGVEKGGDHHWNDSRGKDEKMLRGTKR
ncbi:MAG: hypothetical protein J2P36_22550, partial [Ktedonobacteraceae bacterium]|nr:hypothetical protein [Ktedonobacteraceae bacterium]